MENNAAQDLINVVIAQRDAANNQVAQLQAVLAATLRELNELKEAAEAKEKKPAPKK